MHGDVILTREVAEHGLRTGDIGTVVERHGVSSVADEGYSVEFFDMPGEVLCQVDFSNVTAHPGRTVF